jgi:hypothetical protein
MADAMSGPRAAFGRLIADDLAVATVQPACGESIERIASCEDDQVVVAFAGRLFVEDDDVRRQPARHCLKLYRDAGREFALGLNGSFAVVVYDGRRSELHLVTDRLQSRSLYYCAGSPFLFASEIKAILAFPGVNRQVNPDRMLEFLLRKRLFGSATYYDHIACAPDASVTTWDGASIHSTRYWRPPCDREPCLDLARNARRFYCALGGAIGRACAGATRPALLLSGGLDSRVVGTASPRPLACVTMHRHVGREVRTARRVARRLGYEHHFERLPDAFPLELVTEGSLIADGRDGFHHAQALHLGGWVRQEGVDAMLGGWFLETDFSETDLVQRRFSLLGRGRPVPLLAPIEEVDIPEWVWQCRVGGNRRALGELVPEERLEHVVAEATQRIRSRVGVLCNGAANRQALATVALAGESSAHPTHTNLAAADRTAPALMLLCDAELLELFFEISREHRLFHRLYSHLLTQVDSRLRWVPYSSTGVPVSNWMWPEFAAGSLHQAASWAAEACVRRLNPDRTLAHSAWPPFSRAVRGRPEWHTYLRRRASGSRLADLGVLSGDGLRGLVEGHIAGRRNSWVLPALWVTLEEWLDRYG